MPQDRDRIVGKDQEIVNGESNQRQGSVLDVIIIEVHLVGLKFQRVGEEARVKNIEKEKV